MSLYNSDSVYLLGLGSTAQNSNFTLCEMRSWLSPNCSTHFNISGSGGIRYEAHCEDPSDVDAYRNTLDPGEPWPEPSKDWKVSSLSLLSSPKRTSLQGRPRELIQS